MEWAFGRLAPASFDLIAVDPPWDFKTRSDTRQHKGIRAQYRTLSPEAIASAFPVGELAERHCLCLCWGTWPLIDRQIETVKAWGFRFQTVKVWAKVFASGKPAVGLGFRVRSMCEPVIVATRGSPKHRPFKGLFPGVRREHSRKPDSFYDQVDACCPDLIWRADLFARQSRPGWNTWGDQATKFDGGEL